MIKPFWKSKTVLFNVIVGVIMAAAGMPQVGASPELIAAIMGIGNLILRAVTKEPIGIKPQ